MTEMDLARQCAHNAEVKYIDDKNAFNIAYNSFLDGLKAGKPKWHKVADGDLPKEEKDYILNLKDGTVDIRRVALDGDLEPYVPSISIDFYRDVEKWCEIPKE